MMMMMMGIMEMTEMDGVDFRNLEKRREKSRYAARSRRGRESEIFSDLYEVVPVVQEPTITHVDRIAVLRLAACLCRIRHLAPKLLSMGTSESNGKVKRERKDEDEDGDAMEIEADLWAEDSVAQCLDGFLLVTDTEGTIIYVSKGISTVLGLTQVRTILLLYCYYTKHVYVITRPNLNYKNRKLIFSLFLSLSLSSCW